MEEERALLTKLYFPELRVMCQNAGLQFVPIDLRWGIQHELVLPLAENLTQHMFRHHRV